MSKKANAKLVGAFVITSVALLICALLLYGSGRFFKNTKRFVLYFDKSVAGLSIGAPVVFRGVRIGSVTGIRLVANTSNLELSIPVLVEIDPDTIRTESGAIVDEEAVQGKPLEMLINKGLRARLTMQSFVTGQMLIELEFLPDTPLRFKGDGSIPELPTAVSAMDEITQSLQEMPIKEIGLHVAEAAQGVSRLVNSPDIHEAVTNLNQTLAELRTLTRVLNAKAGPLADKLDRTLGHADQLALGLHEDFKTGRTARLLDSLTQVSERAEGVMVGLESLTRKAEGTVENFGGVVSENSEVMTDLRKALKELATASRALRVWADYLERHPEALIRGKGDDGR